MMANESAPKDETTANQMTPEQRSEELARCHAHIAVSTAAAKAWAERLNGPTAGTVPALLVWARHAQEAGRWTATAARLNPGAEQPQEAVNVDYLEGAHGATWRWLTDVIYERTGLPADGIGLHELSVMAECGTAVQGRDDLKAAYREFVLVAQQLDVDQLMIELREKFPVATADLPQAPPQGEWSIWMNKHELEGILDCDGRHFRQLYPSEIERGSRTNWRFRLDVRDEHIRRRYADWLGSRRRQKVAK